MLKSNNIEPKVRKSALVQISVMLSDTSLHQTFIEEDGLSLILDIFSKALVSKKSRTVEGENSFLMPFIGFFI